ELDEAEDHYRQAQALNPEPKEAAIIEISLGDIAVEREDHEQALIHYQRAIDIDPTTLGAWYNLARTHHNLGNDEEAKVYYQRTIESDPDNVSAYTEYADIYISNNELSQARKVLEQGLQANPNNVELLVFLSSTYFDSD